MLSPTNSVLTPGGDMTTIIASPATNVLADPVFAGQYDTIVSINPWRIQPRFRPTSLVTLSLPVNVLGDYHLLHPNSPAVNKGAAFKGVVVAPPRDIDGDLRNVNRLPQLTQGFDIGADQVVPNTTGGNVYTIHADAPLVPLTGGAFTGQLMSDPLVSPVQFATNGTPNAFCISVASFVLYALCSRSRCRS